MKILFYLSRNNWRYWAPMLIFSVMIIGGYWLYLDEKNQFRVAVDKQLQTIALLKSNQIKSWREERLADACVITENPFFMEAFPEILAGNAVATRKMIRMLRSIKNHDHYADLFVIDSKGAVLFRFDQSPSANEETAKELALQSVQRATPVMGDLHVTSGFDHPHVHIVAPVLCSDGTTANAIGAIILTVDAQQYLYPTIDSWPTSSWSAETILVKQEGDNVLFLNPSRHQPSASAGFKIPSTRHDILSVWGVSGNTGVFKGKDYRGAEVLAVVMPVPSSPWVLIAKMDIEEINQQIHERLLILAALLGSILFFIILLFFLLRLRSGKRHAEEKLILRKRMEQALRLSEEKYRTLFEINSDGILIVDVETRHFVSANKKISEMYGYSMGELLARKVEDLHPKSDLSLIVSHFKMLAAGQKQVRKTAPCVRKDGTVFYADVNSTIMPMDGRLCNVAIFRDVTDRLEMENALRESEERLRTVFESVPIGIFQSTKEGKFIYVNPAVSKMLGYESPEDLMQSVNRTSIAEALYEDPGRRPVLVSEVEQAHSGWKVFENRFRGKGGGVIDTLLSFSERHNLLTGQTFLYGYIQNVTDKKQTEKKLSLALEEARKKRLEVEALLDASRAVLHYQEFTTAARSIFHACAKAIGATAGYVALLSDDGLENKVLFLESGGQPCTVDPDLPMPIRGLRGEAYRSGRTVWDNDFHCSKWMQFMPEGHTRLDNVLFAPLNMNNKTIGLMGYANKAGDFDEDDARMAAAFAEYAAIALNNWDNLNEIVKAKSAAENANQAKSEFLANMSHEIRTPMNAMLGFARILKEQSYGPLNVRQDEYIGFIIESCNRLLNLINDILDLAQVEAGKMEMNRRRFALDPLLTRCRNLFSGLAAGKNLTFQVHVPPWIPKFIMGDDYRLEQVLRNLIGNAVKFTEQGGIDVILSISATDELLFEIRDTGIGIPQDKRGNLFEKFYQVDSSYTKKYAGAGLGLVISRQLIELMGGRIWFESQVGKGTSFFFTIRLEIPEDYPVRGDKGATEKHGDEARRRPLKVLLAEDDVLNQKTISYFLEKEGHAIRVAANGKEVLTALESDDFDIILMDIQMPEMDGVEAARKIRSSSSGKFDPRIPIIALTAYAMKDDRERFLEAGIDDCVTKPVDIKTIMEKMRQLVGSGITQ